MQYRAYATAIGALGVIAAASLGQAPGTPNFGGGQAPNTASANPAIKATVETAPLNLVFPDRYAVPVVLEPNRKIFLMTPTDGVLKSVSTPVGTMVRESQEIAQLDRMEAAARVKIAEAEVKEAQALAAEKPGGVAQARVEAARARAELAQLELDRCTLRAPFAGKILAAPVSPGQYVTKGNTLAELGDYSILKVLVPVDRTQVKPGNDINLIIEGKTVSGQVMATVPMPEMYSPLRELATPWAGAWVHINNSSGEMEPGQRVRGPYTPTQPITALPTTAVTVGEGDTGMVQVVRMGTVLDIPVKIVGDAGFDRTQVSGPFQPNDVAVVNSTVPMVAGTIIRFNNDPAVSGASALNPGTLVDVTPPVGGPVSPATGRGIAPIGSPNAPRTTTTPRPGATNPTPKAPTRTPPPNTNTRPF